MDTRFEHLLLAAGLLMAGSGKTISGQDLEYALRIHVNVKVPMRDGIHLSADIYRPDGEGKSPALILVTPYDNQRQVDVDQAVHFARRGYAVALVDSRGRYDSEGIWDPYVNEPGDGYDAQQWLGRQSWCNGRIGTFGRSYVGFTALMPAPYASAYVKCLFPQSNQQTNYGHIYNDGVMQLNMVLSFGLFCSGRTMHLASMRELDYDRLYQHLPIITALDDVADLPQIKTWMEHTTYDDYWKSYGVKDKYGDIVAPAYLLTGWYDNLLHENWKNFKGFREEGGSREAREGTKIIVGPWTHSINQQLLGIRTPEEMDGWEVDFGPAMFVDVLQLSDRWFDYWLKEIDNGIAEEPPIRIFVMGDNRWRLEKEWPLARTRWKDYYLNSSGQANTLHGDGTLRLEPPSEKSASDQFVYDPAAPVPTYGGQISTNSEWKGPRDRRSVQTRTDVLVYTSQPLEKDLEVTGPVKVQLYAASSAVDTDFTATLTDVHPDGRAVHICEGIQRASFRDSLE